MSAKWKVVTMWVAAIVVVDQVTKAIVDRMIPLHYSIPIIDEIFNLTYIRNTGAAFGIFAGSHEVFRLPFLIGVSILAIGFMVVMGTDPKSRSRSGCPTGTLIPRLPRKP